MVQLSHPYMTTGKTIALSILIFVGKIMSLLFIMLSRVVITFLPRSKCLLISLLQSPSAVILEPKKINCLSVSLLFPIYLPLSDRTRYYDHFLNTNVYFMFYLNIYVYIYIGFPGSSAIEKQIRSLGWENPLEKEIATHSSILA